MARKWWWLKTGADDWITAHFARAEKNYEFDECWGWPRRGRIMRKEKSAKWLKQWERARERKRSENLQLNFGLIIAVSLVSKWNGIRISFFAIRIYARNESVELFGGIKSDGVGVDEMRFAANGIRKMSSNVTMSVPTMIWRSISIHTMRVRYDDYFGTEDRKDKSGGGRRKYRNNSPNFHFERMMRFVWEMWRKFSKNEFNVNEWRRTQWKRIEIEKNLLRMWNTHLLFLVQTHTHT